MRLRKPIREQFRFHQERIEIDNMTKQNELSAVAITGAIKKLVSIHVIGGQNLKVRHADMGDVAPFYYFQFYTFDEHYSACSAGVNPRFQDRPLTYEVEMHSKAVNYLEKEQLEIFVFDDNAPI